MQLFTCFPQVKLLEECLFFYIKIGTKYDYPVYIHHFDRIYSEKFKDDIRKKISKNIFLSD